jgi:hypothetical protein
VQLHLPQQAIQTAALAILHQDSNQSIVIRQERPIMLDNVWRVARVQEFELSQQLPVHGGVSRPRNDLPVSWVDIVHLDISLTFFAMILPVLESLTNSTAPPLPSPKRLMTTNLSGSIVGLYGSSPSL